MPGFTVTAYQSSAGGASAGEYLMVRVLTGASGAQPGAAATASALSVSVTPQASGSWVYGSLLAVSGSVTAESGTTIEDSSAEESSDGLAHVPVRTTGTTTEGTPVTIGASSGGAHISIAAAEILASGTLAEDPSSPAGVYALGEDFPYPATTAAFTPPDGSLLVAVVSANGSPGQVNPMIVSDTSGLGLSWTEVVKADALGAGYAGIWVAPYPQTGTPQPVGLPSGGWELAFRDEFDVAYPGQYQAGPDKSVWADHFNNGDAQRVNNSNEVQWYPHGYYGCSVAGSVLSLTAIYQDPQDIDPSCPDPLQDGGQAGTFTSGMVSSQPGFAATYGYWEARIMDTGPVTGTWPAWWMITRDVAYPPEIDIDEYDSPGYDDAVHLGYRDTAGDWTNARVDTDADWHIYGLLLTSETVTFYRDGLPVSTMTYDGDAYAWTTYFNHAVNDTATSGTGYPLAYQVDYLRFWGTDGVPAQPQITSISPASGIPGDDGTVTVEFGPAEGATSYRVTPAPTDYLADGIGRPGEHESATGSSSPITVTGLNTGAHYNFTLAAINDTGYSIESLPVPAIGQPAAGLLMSAGLP